MNEEEFFAQSEMRPWRREEVAKLCLCFTDRRSPQHTTKLVWFLTHGRPAAEIVVGIHRCTILEARYEVVRRAIEARER
jgi:hypothetical protein